MSSLTQTPHTIDLEHGIQPEEEFSDNENNSVCFSDDNSHEFYSTTGENSYEDYNFHCDQNAEENLEECRSSSSDVVSECCSVDIIISTTTTCIENVEQKNKKKNLEMEMEMEDFLDRDCRICHLSLVSSSPCFGEDNGGIAIELGCSCKDDLAAAHKHCAETWFKIKGNKTCEICNSIARNVVGPNDIEAVLQVNESGVVASPTSMAIAAAASNNTETRSCLNGHRFLNFLLACMVFAFVISWLFHFNIPS